MQSEFTPAHVIRLEGEYDLTRRDELASLFGSINGAGALVIDMTNVSYIDSTMLSELGSLRRRAQEIPIKLAGANEHLRRVLSIVNFDSLFEITD